MTFTVIWRNNALMAPFDASALASSGSGDGTNFEKGLTAKGALVRARELRRCGHSPVVVGPEGRQRDLKLLQIAIWADPLLSQFRTR